MPIVNKNLIYIAVAVIVLLLIGVGGFFLMNRNSASTPNQQVVTNPQKTVTPAPTQNAPVMKTLKDLLLANIAQKCTFQDSSGSANISGSSYIAGGKVRSDFTSNSAGTAVSGHMIVDGKTSYVWMDGQTTGFKMSFDPASTSSTTNSQQGVDANKAMNYNCSPWSVDSSLFTPPAAVKFTDFGTVAVPPKTGTSSPSAGSQCSACDSLTGQAQTQCRTALKCN